MPQLNPQESFRLGFLLRCAEEGCTPEEIQERVKLAAQRPLHVKAGSVQDAWNVLKAVGYFPVHASALGIAGAGALGAAGGYGLAKFQNSDVDPDEAKRQELISAYKLQADLARRRAQQRTYSRGAPTAPKFL